MKYLLPFLTSFSAAILLGFLGLRFGKRINWRGRHESRHFHARSVIRVGGLIMGISFIFSAVITPGLPITAELFGLLVAVFAAMVLGTWDDIKEVHWKFQLFYQIAIAIFVFICGLRILFITNPLTGGILMLDSSAGVFVAAVMVIFWIVLIINVMNWIDGIDGLSGGVTLIAALTIFVLSLKPEVYQPAVGIISTMLAGAVLGFLVFNFNPSKIIAGTSGSIFMGLMLSALAIYAGTKIATALLVMALPIIDFVWVIKERIRNGQSIFKPDKNHLHHKLMELGWSQHKIAFLYYSVTACVSLIALNTRFIGKSVTLVSSALVIGAFLVLVSRKISKMSHGNSAQS